MIPEGSKKRCPSESADEDKEQNLAARIKHHDTLWFDDGNIVLIAENIAFRVHSSILSRRSPVFKDMFAMPQPMGAECMENCPVVQMTDPPSELGDFLNYIYNGEE